MKRAYLGLFEGVYIAGRTEGFKQGLKEKGIKIPENSIPLDKMIYVSAFQGGIQKFVTLMPFEENHPVDKFISEKVMEPNEQTSELIKQMIYLIETYTSDVSRSNVVMILSFVCDLIAGMQNDSSIINVSGIPKLSDIKKSLPPELAVPICNIVSQLTSIDELLPAPSLTISRDEVRRFHEILNSNIYTQYSSSHKELEYSNSEKDKVKVDIKNKGQEIIKQGNGMLSRRRVSMNIIPILPKIIDAAFGKLPGTLAQIAGDIATKALQENKNIVVYQFRDWANEYANASASFFKGKTLKKANKR